MHERMRVLFPFRYGQHDLHYERTGKCLHVRYELGTVQARIWQSIFLFFAFWGVGHPSYVQNPYMGYCSLSCNACVSDRIIFLISSFHSPCLLSALPPDFVLKKIDAVAKSVYSRCVSRGPKRRCALKKRAAMPRYNHSRLHIVWNSNLDCCKRS